jgi:hypothetical protein
MFRRIPSWISGTPRPRRRTLLRFPSTFHRFDAKNSQVILRAATSHAMHRRDGGRILRAMFEMVTAGACGIVRGYRPHVGVAVACRTAQATFDYLLAPPRRMPIIAVRRCSSVPPIIVGAVCSVVVADPFREYVRTPLGFDHTPSPTRIIYSGLYRRSIMAPRSEPAVLMPVHMAAC